MKQVSDSEVAVRMAFDNPWWESGRGIDAEYREFPVRAYLPAFSRHVENREVRRAVVLLGPRRVGKTVMVHQTIQRLLDAGVPGNRILYLSLETPLYTGLALEKLLLMFFGLHDHDSRTPVFVFYDEVQYLKDWEVHLKSLVDSFKHAKFAVTGSAAAALRLKSRESGAGRLTEFMLPPLTFSEFLDFIGVTENLIEAKVSRDELVQTDRKEFRARDIEALNRHFVDYLNFGGYPEAVMKKEIRDDTGRYIKADIIDKVLLRDLPSLYGIQDIQELNRLFTVVAYNTGDEVNLEGLSKSSGASKNTLKRYLEYLEAAFLIRRINRVDVNAKRFKRATHFKVYLTNPSMRAALFGPVDPDDDATMGNLTETAIFAQWIHNDQFIDHLHYARWARGEVDIVAYDFTEQCANWAVEVKWRDRYFDRPGGLSALLEFCLKNQDVMKSRPTATTRTKTGEKIIWYQDTEIAIDFLPSALYCYAVGRNLTDEVELRQAIGLGKVGSDTK